MNYDPEKFGGLESAETALSGLWSVDTPTLWGADPLENVLATEKGLFGERPEKSGL